MDERITKAYEKLKQKLETAIPVHPETQEEGIFVQFVGPKGQPLYRTTSGKEFFVPPTDEKGEELPEGLTGKYTIDPNSK